MPDPIQVYLNLANATPMREFDWMAYRDPEDAHHYGYGRTEAEARADLERLELEEACEAECWPHGGDREPVCQFACGNGGRCPLETTP